MCIPVADPRRCGRNQHHIGHHYPSTKINKPEKKKDVLFRDKQVALMNPGKIWHQGCFDLDRHQGFFRFILRLKIEVGVLVELLSFSVVLCFFTHTALLLF